MRRNKKAKRHWYQNEERGEVGEMVEAKIPDKKGKDDEFEMNERTR